MSGTRAAARVAVTGGAGFIGTAVRRAAAEKGMAATALVRDCEVPLLEAGAAHVVADWNEPDSVETCLRDLGPDLVVHCAGSSARGTGRPSDIYDANVALTARLLDAIHAVAPGAGVAVLSSAAVYGPDAPSPTSEEAPLDPRSHYAASKVMTESVVAAFVRFSRSRCAIARPFNAMGPGEPSGSVVSDLAVQAFAAPAGSSGTVSLREVASVRDFVDVRDLADALLLIAERGESGAAYNVCTGAGTSIARLVKEAGRVWGRDIEVEVTQPDAASTTSIGDSAKLRGLGWAPARSLPESLESVMADFVRRR